ncbi:hypothetical protein [Kineococcus indalonis]|uniref:hypothetical protein n=1 Tax=Kineococcus indalonis TaxID=2696566 RepID=UPI001412E89D|nr:hypothetical protein [Kineococcus indalonis]NAZ87719.1 hypothetical protein [Kineococcus indalonis]
MILLAVVALALVAAGAWVLLQRPWLAPWGVVLLFGTTAELRLRVSDALGVSKDAYVLLLVVVAALSVLRGRASLAARLPPAAVWFPLAVLVVLYLADLGGGHGAAWLFGTRLLLEPMLLLLVGLLTPRPDLALRHLVLALSVFVPLQAVIAWVQQAVGPDALVHQWGYAFGSQVRLSSGGSLRSPGTYEEAFSLAAQAVLAACVAVTVASRRRAALLLAGAAAVLAATQVRTAALQLAALVLLLLVRHGRARAAAVGVLGAGAGAVLVAGAFLRSSTVPGGPVKPLLFTLNGRLDAWAVAYEGPVTLLRGNGVGALGAGSTRAEAGLVAAAPAYDPTRESTPMFAGNSAFIDSSWGQVLSDVGLLGVLALLAWVVLHVWWLRGPLRRDVASAWLAAAVLAVSVVDWVSRTTLGSYPTGFTTLYLLGLATGAALVPRTASPSLPSTRTVA